MRPVLVLAVALLALTAAFDASVGARRGNPVDGTRRAVQVVAASKGNFLSRAEYGRNGLLGNLIWVGDANLSFDSESAGLRVATLAPTLEVRDHSIFDVAASEADIDGFERLCARASIGSVLVIAASGRIRPRGMPEPAQQSARLQSVFHALGADLRPFEASSVSYALLTARRPGGWVKLAESFSRDKGVVLAFTLDYDLSRYDDYEGDTFVDEFVGDASSERLIQLETELASAISDRSPTTLTDVSRVGGVRKPSLYAPVPARIERDTPAFHFIAWEGLELGLAPRFTSSIGLRDDGWGSSNGVIFSVRVDGEEVARQPVGVDGAPKKPAWRTWSVDLSEFAERTVRFELRVDSNGNEAGDYALWGSPTISFQPRGR